MPITVSPQRVAEKLRLDGTHTMAIESTIGEVLTQISVKLKPEYKDTSNAEITAIINLGALEVCCGEYLKEYANDETEESGGFSVGPLKIEENKAVKTRGARADEWINKGWKRLKPYLVNESNFYFGSA